MPTVRDFLDACKHLPDDAVVRPQWQPGSEPGDHEPGVEVVGFDRVGDQVLIRVKLFYLDDITDEEA